MNNKGQTLVIFILLLPFLLILIALIVDFGSLTLEKNKMQNTVKEIIYDELNNNFNQENSKMRITTLLTENINDVLIDKLNITSDSITISISKDYKGMFSNILDKNLYKIKITYKAIKNGNSITIKKE